MSSKFFIYVIMLDFIWCVALSRQRRGWNKTGITVAVRVVFHSTAIVPGTDSSVSLYLYVSTSASLCFLCHFLFIF